SVGCCTGGTLRRTPEQADLVRRQVHTEVVQDGPELGRLDVADLVRPAGSHDRELPTDESAYRVLVLADDNGSLDERRARPGGGEVVRHLDVDRVVDGDLEGVQRQPGLPRRGLLQLPPAVVE